MYNQAFENSTNYSYTYNGRPISNDAIFNDLERPSSHISRSRYYLMLNISEIVQNTDIVKTEYWQGRKQSPYSRVSFRTTLSDLAKYSISWSILQSLCDSWASCYEIFVTVMCILGQFVLKWLGVIPVYRSIVKISWR